jgi:tetratricopeptide (TPR) repeat protein
MYSTNIVIKDDGDRLSDEVVSKSAMAEAAAGTVVESRTIPPLKEVAVVSDVEAKRIFTDAQSDLAARKYDEAAALFGRAARLNPTWSEPLVERAKLDAKLGRFTEAIEDSTQALQLNPNDAIAFNLRGYARYSVNHIKDAISDFGEALRLKPDYHDAYQNRGNAKWALGDKEGAKEDYTMARSLEKKR